MAKLKAGEKVVQKFEVTFKFKAEEGDRKWTASDLKEAIGNISTDNENPVAVSVKEIKESV